MPDTNSKPLFKHILVPTDGGALSFEALELAFKLAGIHGAKLSVMTALPVYPPVYAGDGYVMEPLTAKEWNAIVDKKAATIEADVAKRLRKLNPDGADAVAIPFIGVRDNQPWQAIVDTAKKMKCDLIVMSSHGRRGLSALLLGSETTKVLTHSKIPVLVCR
jgi:nucleotide-binding universal stress UspA family protein